MDISNLEKILIKKTGKYSCIISIFAVAFQYWGVINLENIHPQIIDVLYVFIIANGLSVTPYIYREERAKISLSKLCPHCNTPLEKLPKYKCPKCGLLEFKKNDDNE